MDSYTALLPRKPSNHAAPPRLTHELLTEPQLLVKAELRKNNSEMHCAYTEYLPLNHNVLWSYRVSVLKNVLVKFH